MLGAPHFFVNARSTKKTFVNARSTRTKYFRKICQIWFGLPQNGFCPTQKVMEKTLELVGSPRTAARQLIAALISNTPPDAPDSTETSKDAIPEKYMLASPNEPYRMEGSKISNNNVHELFMSE